MGSDPDEARAVSAHAYVRERTGVSGDINGRAKMINVTVAVTVTNESFMNVVNKRQLLVTPIYSKNVFYTTMSRSNWNI